ncbi:VWD domain-containing protein [Candidatus Binatia bacterium]|nr:VWD domain-containing protein [Candidatus Binatia bacterium]
MAAALSLIPNLALAHSSCQVQKLRSVAQAIHDVFACQRQAVRGQEEVATTCVDLSLGRLRRGFTKAEAQLDCISRGDRELIEDELRQMPSDLTRALLPTEAVPPSCSAQLVGATGRYAGVSIRALVAVMSDPNARRFAARRGRAAMRFLRVFSANSRPVHCDVAIGAKEALQLVSSGLGRIEEHLMGCERVSADDFAERSYGPWLESMKHARKLGYQLIDDAQLCPSRTDTEVQMARATLRRAPQGDDSIEVMALPFLGHSVLQRRTLDGSIAIFTPTGGIAVTAGGDFSAVDGEGNIPNASRMARAAAVDCSDTICNSGYSQFFQCWQDFCSKDGRKFIQCSLIAALAGEGVTIPLAIILQAGLLNGTCNTPEGASCSVDPSCLSSVCSGNIGTCRLTYCLTRGSDRARNGTVCDGEASGFFNTFPRCGLNPEFIAHGVCQNGQCLPKGERCQPMGATCVGEDGEARCVSATPTAGPSPTPTSPAPSPTPTGGATPTPSPDASPTPTGDGTPTPTPDETPTPGPSPTSGNSWGDPHLTTFDGLAYDLQAVGEFVLVESLADDLKVQVRTAPFGNSTVISINVAIALWVAGDRVAVYVDREPPLYIHGVPTSLAGPRVLSGGGVVAPQGNDYLVTWPDGSRVAIQRRSTNLDVVIALASARSGDVRGLLGDYNESRENELKTREGIALELPLSRETLYDVYANSWRVTQEGSLFDYVGGQSTATFTDRNFPRAIVTSSNVPPASRDEAESTCRAAGVGDGVVLENCILDVSLTGDAAFAGTPATIPDPGDTVAPTSDLGPGLRLQMFGPVDIHAAVPSHFAGLAPNAFTVTRAGATPLTVTETIVPVVNVPSSQFDTVAWYNVGPNGVIDPGSTVNAPLGDDISIQPPGGNENYGGVLSGFLFVPYGGPVTFSVGIDDAFDLVVNDRSIGSYPGDTGFRTFTMDPVEVAPGLVPIRLYFGEHGGNSNVVLSAIGGGLSGSVLPAELLFHAE